MKTKTEKRGRGRPRKEPSETPRGGARKKLRSEPQKEGNGRLFPFWIYPDADAQIDVIIAAKVTDQDGRLVDNKSAAIRYAIRKAAESCQPKSK